MEIENPKILRKDKKFFVRKLLINFPEKNNKQPEKENACAAEQGCQTSPRREVLAALF